MGITLAIAKKHCKVTSNDEDDLIKIYMDAAAGYVRNFLDDDENVPDEPDVVAAQLMIILDLYDNRTGQVEGTTIVDNPAVMRLLRPYRKNLGV